MLFVTAGCMKIIQDHGSSDDVDLRLLFQLPIRGGVHMENFKVKLKQEVGEMFYNLFFIETESSNECYARTLEVR